MQNQWALIKPRGLTRDQIEVLREAQDGLCLVCRLPLAPHASRTVADHCHETGRVRGLVHEVCNIRLGHVERMRRGRVRSTHESLALARPVGWVADCLRFLGVSEDEMVSEPTLRYGNLSPDARLRELMFQAGLTARQAAKELGIGYRTIRQYCAGEQDVPKVVMMALEYLVLRGRQVTGRGKQK